MYAKYLTYVAAQAVAVARATFDLVVQFPIDLSEAVQVGLRNWYPWCIVMNYRYLQMKLGIIHSLNLCSH